MGYVTTRTSLTARADYGMGIWNQDQFKYRLETVLLGNNPINNLEVVSSINILNLPEYWLHFNPPYSSGNYSPKLHLSAIHSVARSWNLDGQASAAGYEKSGSWPILLLKTND